MIPNRIIQTHKSRSAVPTRDEACIQRIRELHPDWEIEFFSDGDCIAFIRARYPQYLDLYQWFPRPVMRADFFRILSVHAFGGFYLDTDMWMVNPLDPLRQYSAVFPWERIMTVEEFAHKFPAEHRQGENLTQVGNYAFGAEAGHPFLAAILREIIRRTRFINAEACTDSDILYATGPDLVTSVKYRDKKASQDVTLLYGDAYQPIPFEDFSNNRYGKWFRFGSFGTHLMSGVWREYNG